MLTRQNSENKISEKKRETPVVQKLSDEDLLQNSIDGNFQAFEELVKRYEGRIYRLGLKFLRSAQDAEDLLQKTFLSIFEKMHQFRGDSKVSTWIYRIATNHALMKLRQDKTKSTDSLDAPIKINHENLALQLVDGKADVSESFQRKILLSKLEEAISELPDIYRLVFILRDVEGFSNQEVAKMLNLTIPAVKSRILRARLFLREKLSNIQAEEDKI